jgi:membrane associated rhomboid family serine protease
MSLASQQGNTDAFLTINFATSESHHTTGALIILGDLLRGEWWRLLTCAFTHAGLLHLGMNMYVLFSFGPLLERMWGHYRFLALYLIAGVGGSVVAVLSHIYFPGRPETLLLGASGALCGLIGSMLGWALMNKAFLPPQIAGQLIRNVMINAFLLAMIGFMVPGVSNAGHFGGGLTGFLLAFPLNFNRFGKGQEKVMGIVGIVLIPVLMLAFLYTRLPAAGNAPNNEEIPAKKAPKKVETPPESELDVARRLYRSAIVKGDGTALDSYYKLAPFVKKLRKEGGLSNEERSEALSISQTARKNLQTLVDSLSKGKAKDYQDKRIEKGLEISYIFFRNWGDYINQFEKCLDKKGRAVQAELSQLQFFSDQRDELLPQVQNSIFLSAEK